MRKILQNIVNIFQLLIIGLENSLNFMYLLSGSIVTKYGLFIGCFVGTISAMFFAKLLYFPLDMTWAGFLVDIIDKLIAVFDKLVGYEMPEPQINSPAPDLDTVKPMANGRKLLLFCKKAFVWTFVGGLVTYGGFYCVSLTFGLNKLLLLHLIPYMTIVFPSPLIIEKDTLFLYNWAITS